MMEFITISCSEEVLSLIKLQEYLLQKMREELMSKLKNIYV